MNWTMKKTDQEKDFKHKNFQDKKRKNIQTTHNPIMVYKFLTDTSFDWVHVFLWFWPEDLLSTPKIQITDRTSQPLAPAPSVCVDPLKRVGAAGSSQPTRGAHGAAPHSQLPARHGQQIPDLTISPLHIQQPLQPTELALQVKQPATPSMTVLWTRRQLRQPCHSSLSTQMQTQLSILIVFYLKQVKVT